MIRGDLVTVALPGDQGKPRPTLIVQSDYFGELGSVTVLPITGTLIDAPLLRVLVEPNEQNGLAKRSEIMVDKPQTPSRSRLRAKKPPNASDQPDGVQATPSYVVATQLPATRGKIPCAPRSTPKRLAQHPALMVLLHPNHPQNGPP